MPMAKILIVDDEEKMRTLLAMIVSGQGYEADTAADGREALTKFSFNNYDMVLSDIKMPVMDGKELIGEMRKGGNHTPVVFLTAFATVDSAVEMMRQGAADYITKPFDPDKILITVERTLKLSRLIHENIEMKKELKRAEPRHTLVYRAGTMGEVVAHARNVATVDTAVLITDRKSVV